MALLHRADIRPSKLDLLAAWLPGRSWFRGVPSAALTKVGACRFDDPAGEVGVEIMLVRAGDGPLLHVPLTYRGAPLDGGDGHLVGTLEHSVLGRRWVYDACGDPVYAAVLATAILTGGGEAQEFFDVEGRREYRRPDLSVRGDGTAAQVPGVTAVTRVDDGDPTVIGTDRGELNVVRAPGPPSDTSGVHGGTLVGRWAGGAVALAYIPEGMSRER